MKMTIKSCNLAQRSHSLPWCTAVYDRGNWVDCKIATTELYYIYLEIGLLYFRQSKKCGKKHGGRWAVNDVKRVILRHNFMKYTTDRLRTVGKAMNSPPWL